MTTIEDVKALADDLLCAAAVDEVDSARQKFEDAIERLTAERDSALLAYKTSEDDVFNLTQKVIPNLRAERDALQADAARYRWLRDMDEDPICSLAAMWTDCKGSALSISKKVDAVVDAARGKNTT